MAKIQIKKMIGTIVWGAVSIVLVVAFIVGCTIASSWSTALTGFFGSVGASGSGSGARFEAEFETEEEIEAYSAEVSAQIVEEGAVLLKNENDALPVSSGSNVSVFGVTSYYWITEQKPTGTSNPAFYTALQNAGLNYNTTLRSLYKTNAPAYGSGGSMGDGSSFNDWSVDEMDYSEYTDDVKNSYASYSDAAFVVLSRGGSEGSDIPVYMDAQGGSYDESYLSLTDEEESLLENVCANFDRVILIIHSPSGLDMEVISAYDIDGIIWLAGTGDVELDSLAALLTGESDFSGRLVDTHLMNNREGNPAVQNFGDFRYVDTDGELTGYSYVNYAEGIYVGYRYHETRYEDSVTGLHDAGSYSYEETVAYPFGYGLSYNDYAWSDFEISGPDADGDVTVSVTVTNNGSQAGKDVVEIYYQAPYTEYDIENGIEKASVNLIGFAKTGTIEKGGSENVTVTFNEEDMASWDSTLSHDNVKGAYILDEGTYYITAARDAHSAVNNILAARGYTDGLTGAAGSEAAADTSLVSADVVLSSTESITEASTGATYQNNFDDILLDDAVYLSRTDWSQVEEGLTYADGTMTGVSNVMDADGTVGTKTISDDDQAAFESTGWDSAGNPNGVDDYDTITTGASNGLSLEDMYDEDGNVLDFDDEQWDLLLDQLSLSEMNRLYGYGGYQTIEIESVGKPETLEYDGPSKIYNLFSGSYSYVFPTEIMMTSTWNTELIAEVGCGIGEECLLQGIAGWYAPAMNTHRTAFGGRNFEYYSEDGVLAGSMAAAEISAVQSKGVYAYMKHFALNEQETNRGSNGRYAVWATEQSVREVYLKPFQMAVEDGGANGAMASMNRIGSRCAIYSYSLLTAMLREEWGFTGIVVTDYISGLSEEDIEAGLAAGLNLQLITSENLLSSSQLEKAGVQFKLRETAHYILYTQADSLAMNGYNYGFPVYVILLIALGVVILLYLALSGYFVIKYDFIKEKNAGWMKMSKVDTIIAIAAAGVLLVLLVIVAVWFFTTALPALQFAFQI